MLPDGGGLPERTPLPADDGYSEPLLDLTVLGKDGRRECCWIG